MSLQTFLKNWEKTHPITEPKTDDNKVANYLLSGGDSPLPLWPKLPKVKK